MDSVVKEEEDGIDVSIDVKKEVKIEESDEYQNVMPYKYKDHDEQHDIELHSAYIKKRKVEGASSKKKTEEEDDKEYENTISREVEPKIELIDEIDVKKEEIDDNDYQLPYEYRNWMEKIFGEEQSRSRKAQCQRCYKFIAVRCFADAKVHAVSHTNLKRFKCEQCSYGSWHSAGVQKHINHQHKNKSCSVKEVQLSLDEQLELRKLARECFPGMDENSRSIIMIDGKRFNKDNTPFEKKPTDEETKKMTEQCRKCNTFIVISCFDDAKKHSVIHTNLKRFKCEKCNYGSWHLGSVQKHIKRQHKNMPCLIHEIQLSKEEQLELIKLTKEYFPKSFERSKRNAITNDEGLNIDDTQDDINEENNRKKASEAVRIRKSAQCQKCYKVVTLACFTHAEAHAATHTSLKRFECELCNYKAFNRSTVKRHINFRHENESCSMKEIQLSKDEQLEFEKLTVECFPEVIKGLKRKPIVDEKSLKVEEEHSTISRKRQRTTDAD